MGGSASGNKSESDSEFSQGVWKPQGDSLNNMYNQMSSLWGKSGNLGGILQNIAGGLGGYNQGLMQQGQQGQQNALGGGAFGDTSDARNALMQSMQGTGSGQTNTGQMYQDIVGGPGNTYIDPMVDAMKQGANQNRETMQSNTGMQAANMGQAGGSRHAMQNAMTNKQVNQDMMNQETNMRGQNYAQDMGWKMDIANKADQGVQSTQDRYMQMLGGANQSANAGMGYGQGLQNLGMGSMAPYTQAYNAPWQMGGQYSNILGSPTVLGQGNSSAKSAGGGAGGGMMGGKGGGGSGGGAPMNLNAGNAFTPSASDVQGVFGGMTS